MYHAKLDDTQNQVVASVGCGTTVSVHGTAFVLTLQHQDGLFSDNFLFTVELVTYLRDQINQRLDEITFSQPDLELLDEGTDPNGPVIQ